MKRGKRIVNGWVVLDKPLGLTSTQALGKVRWALGAAKGGHGGTLDPLATGILPLAFGEATKALPYVVDASKTYRFTIRFGLETTTLDAEGAVTATSDARPATAAVEAALAAFHGTIDQVPPAFSAIKVDGERAYDLARAGETVDLAARPVQIHRFHLIGRDDADQATFEVECGKGTYVRALARDLSRALGTVGHVCMLRRLRVGPFGTGMAVTLDHIQNLVENSPDLLHTSPPDGILLPVVTALDDIPALAVTAGDARALKDGRAIDMPGTVQNSVPDTVASQQVVRLMAPAGLVALGRVDGPLVRPVRVFNLD
ncbi:tRNA pseudouridine(55) synthase TruB [Zavarzinia compransoris]|uniref:tRNA pseudouridine(55) synthase TruB n=1 Tax=Zavarzinia compransoris TaxID=1264899 RepID=UPI0010E7040E|nr:tRNA pseudouridine(55) synthase TruB [Zavarzinia compransoris]TDP44261.1 tRNA pseudouridine synthase B [Zavarzinia compransoris]